MISSPSASFTAEEVKRGGASPVFHFYFFPYYFKTGMVSGEGSEVNTSIVGSDRVQVDHASVSASWTSDVLEIVLDYPGVVTPSWLCNSPGYEPGVVEFRTSMSSTGILSASWVTLTNGVPINIYQYYQWRVSWTATRSWFFDTELDMDEKGFYFVDSYNPADPYQSYFTDGSGPTAYLEDMEIVGEYKVNKGDIKENGIINLESNEYFSDISAADHTLQLLNRNKKYSPGHKNFIFAEENWWYKKGMRIEFGYTLPNGKDTETIIIYEGIILQWGPFPHSSDGGKRSGNTVDIYSRNIVSEMLEKKIGQPSEDGDSQPLVFGEILRQAEQLGDETLEDANTTEDFESGGMGKLVGVDTGNGGIAEISSDDPFEGNYCLKTSTIASAGSYARGRFQLFGGATSIQPLFICYIKFDTIPETLIDKNMYFMTIYNSGGTQLIKLYVGSDYRVYAYNYTGTWKETDWYINQDLGVWLRVSMGLYADNPGVFKLWVNGNEVLNWDDDDVGENDGMDYSAYTSQGVSIGVTVTSGEIWSIYYDNLEFYNDFYPVVYKVSGGPYETIGTVYSDGAIIIQKPVTLATPGVSESNLVMVGGRWQYITVRYVAGTPYSPGNMIKVPEHGAVIFTELLNLPKGTIFFKLIKNDTVHPVDIIEEILTEIGLDSKIGTASFATAKAAIPNDSLGCFFENMSARDAIISITSRCLIQFNVSEGLIELEAYDGIAPVAYDLSLTESDLVSMDPVIDMEQIYTKISTKWGWYERNHRLYAVYKDQEAIDKMGLYESELDFSWGNEVGSDNGGMAKEKASMFLSRSKGARARVPWSGFRNLMRLKLGGKIQLISDHLGENKIYRVMGINYRMDPPRGVDLQLVSFLGEN